MGIQLTSFEMLTIPESDPLKQKYRQQQEAAAAEWRVDFTTEGFDRDALIGKVGLHQVVEMHYGPEVDVVGSQAA